MPNMRIIHSNAIDSAELASTPACAATMPVTNLQLARRGAFARVVGLTAWTISGTLSGPLSGLCLVGHNLTGGATVRLRLYSDLAKTALLYDSTALPVGTPQPWGNPAASPNGGLQWGVLPWLASGQLPGTPEYFSHWFAPQTLAVAFTLDIADDFNADGFLQLGRLYLGDYWSPAVPQSPGLRMAWAEASRQTRTDGGSLRTDGYYPYRTFSINLDLMAETDRAAFLQIVRKVGLRLDLLVSFFPEAGGDRERDYLAAVKFIRLPNMTAPLYGRFDSSAELEEI